MPQSESIDYRVLVADAEGEDYPETEHEAYLFSRKTFKEDDQAGVYNENPN